jgi:peptide/nickel transport system substrate-binding protein
MFANNKKMWMSLFSVLVALSMVLVACGPTPAPVEIKETTIVKETQIVKETVKETVIVEGTPQVVEKEVTTVVEKVVTATPEPTKAVSNEPVFGGEFHGAFGGVPPTLDTMATSSGSVSGVTNMLQETLVAFGEDFGIVPMLADSWDISDDGLTYTFHLRQGVKFHNGKEMTSDDVMASMDRFLQVTARKTAFEVMESYEAPDPYTFVTTLKNPFAGWLLAVASPSSSLVIQPREAIEGKAANELVVPDDILGTGPYMLKEYVADQYAHLVRFDDYSSLPGPMDGLGGGKIAYFDDVYLHFVAETGARLAGLEVGDYDWIAGPSPSDIPVIQKSEDMKLVIIYPASGGYLLFNHSPEEQWSSDVTFRQAVLAALDMEALGMATTGGHPELFGLNESLWPPETAWYFSDDFAKAQYNQANPEKAKELLAQAGYNGEEIVIATYNAEDYVRTMLTVASQLNAAGVTTKVELYDWPGIFAKWAENTGWHISSTYNNTFQLLDPGAATVMFTCASTHPVAVHYCNPDMDAAFDALSKTATLDEYKEALKPIQRIFYEDLPNIKTFERYSVEAIRSNIMGYKGHGRGGTYRFYNVWRQQ